MNQPLSRYVDYMYSYPHKTAYRPFSSPVSLFPYLEQVEGRNASLYFHIPFCSHKCGSLFFFLASAIGMIRLPDFYSRLHASGNSETLGLMLACLGLVIYEGPTLLSVKIIIVFLLVFLANPIGTHILGKAALKSGHPVWTKKDQEEE